MSERTPLEIPMAATLLGELMTGQVECGFEHAGLEDVIAKMQASQIRRLPVLDDAQRIVGRLSLGDLAARSDAEMAGFTWAEISAPG